MLHQGRPQALFMPKITALILTHNDARRIGRTLDSLRPCDEVLVIDRASDDDTARIAREHGATVKQAIEGVGPGAYAVDTQYEWVLCLLPGEALSEALEASLFEWKETEPDPDTLGFSCVVREETGTGWRVHRPEMRLANRNRMEWTGAFPLGQDRAGTIEGYLLKFRD